MVKGFPKISHARCLCFARGDVLFGDFGEYSVKKVLQIAHTRRPCNLEYSVKEFPQIPRSRCPCWRAWSCVGLCVLRSASWSVFLSSLPLLFEPRSWYCHALCASSLFRSQHRFYRFPLSTSRVSRHFLAYPRSAGVLYDVWRYLKIQLHLACTNGLRLRLCCSSFRRFRESLPSPHEQYGGWFGSHGEFPFFWVAN